MRQRKITIQARRRHRERSQRGAPVSDILSDLRRTLRLPSISR